MRAFALAIMLAATATPALAANEWGASPLQDAAIIQASYRFATWSCPGWSTSLHAFDRAVSRYVPESVLHGQEVESRTSAISMKLLRNKPAGCERVIADFGPEGRLIPGIVIPGPYNPYR